MKKIHDFLENASDRLREDESITALCAGGSWMTNELDEFSDLDLVLITKNKISDSKKEMLQIASRLGNLTAAFTGEHIGEKRVLICLYDDPILHVDLKFLQIHEFNVRVENPAIIWEREHVISKLYKTTIAKWPSPDYQWIEDRFWVWVHYAATKLGRGEFFETIDFLSFIRLNVIGPLFHLKYKSLPRGVRKLDLILGKEDLEKLKKTVPVYAFDSIKSAIYQTVLLYRELRELLYDPGIVKFKKAEETSMFYLDSLDSIVVKNPGKH
jgi:Streptomycin adenylyltransferase